VIPYTQIPKACRGLIMLEFEIDFPEGTTQRDKEIITAMAKTYCLAQAAFVRMTGTTSRIGDDPVGPQLKSFIETSFPEVKLRLTPRNPR
jgi:hypothetical protein